MSCAELDMRAHDDTNQQNRQTPTDSSGKWTEYCLADVGGDDTPC